MPRWTSEVTSAVVKQTQAPPLPERSSPVSLSLKDETKSSISLIEIVHSLQKTIIIDVITLLQYITTD